MCRFAEGFYDDFAAAALTAFQVELGSFAGKLVQEGNFGTTVAVQNNAITYNWLSDVAGKTKYVSEDNQMVNVARSIGISFGDGKKFKGIK